MKRPARSTTMCLIGLMTLAQASLAGDRVLVTSGDTLRAFDFDTGQELPGSPIVLSGTAGDLGRSASGMYAYVIDDKGQFRVVDTRTRNVFVSPAPVLGVEPDLSPDGLRGDVLFAVEAQGDVARQDAAGFGATGTLPIWGEGVAALPNGKAVYAITNFGTMWEWDAATGAVTNPVFIHLMNTQEMEASIDSRLVVSVGNQESGSSPNHDWYQPIVQVFDTTTGTELLRRNWSLNNYRTRTRVAVSGSDPSKFWVLVDESIFAIQVYGDVVLDRGQLQAWGSDLASNDGGDLFVLEKGRVQRFDGGTQYSGSMPLPQGDWDRLVVVPELPSPGGVEDMLRPEWVGLLAALEMKGMDQPWKLNPLQASAEGCDPKAVHQAMKRAFYWLEQLEAKGGILDPTQVSQFLASAKGSGPVLAEYFLDLLLLEVYGD